MKIKYEKGVAPIKGITIPLVLLISMKYRPIPIAIDTINKLDDTFNIRLPLALKYSLSNFARSTIMDVIKLYVSGDINILCKSFHVLDQLRTPEAGKSYVHLSRVLCNIHVIKHDICDIAPPISHPLSAIGLVIASSLIWCHHF